jgi:hypothetical protein
MSIATTLQHSKLHIKFLYNLWYPIIHWPDPLLHVYKIIYGPLKYNIVCLFDGV